MAIYFSELDTFQKRHGRLFVLTGKFYSKK